MGAFFTRVDCVEKASSEFETEKNQYIQYDKILSRHPYTCYDTFIINYHV